MPTLLALLLALLIPFSRAQGRFSSPENSGAVLTALQAANSATITTGQSAAAYTPSNASSYADLADANAVLLSAWQAVLSTAQSSAGFYSADGSLAITAYVDGVLAPATTLADAVYTAKRDVFIEGGFIEYINPGLLKLRTAVDAAGAAVQARAPAAYLSLVGEAFLQVTQNYANTQEIQEFGAVAFT